MNLSELSTTSAAAILLITILAGCGDGGNNGQSPSGGDAHIDPEAVEALADAREALDRSLFAPEIDAGRHEAVFIKLWDGLRAQEPFSVLLKFPVGKLILGNPAMTESPDWGVDEIKFAEIGEPPRELDNEAFQQLVAKLAQDGWRIEQSEWHHSKFQPATANSPARSTVAFEIHALYRKAQQRVILRGDLAVTWGDIGADGPLPAEIDARGVQLIARKGKTMFGEWKVVDPVKEAPRRFPRTSPILVRDLDGDGLPEVVAAGCNLTYQNDGEFRFTKREFLDYPITRPAEAGLLADMTGDGFVDFVGGSLDDGSLLLFRGGERGYFPSEPVPLPVPPLVGLHALSAGDIDGDGDLDLYIGQWKAPYVGGSMPTPFYDANDGHPDYLLRNDGDGVFTDITEAAGLVAKRDRRTFSASLVDLDSDHDLDLVVVADFSGIDLHLNDGTGHFTDATTRLVAERHGFGMSHTFGDWDGDGTEDLYMVGMSSTTARRLDDLGLAKPGFEKYAQMRAPMTFGNRLYLRSPDGTLTQPPLAASAARTGWSWGCAAADFDLDGDTDLYVSNGHLSGASAKDYCTRFWCHDIYAGNSEEDPLLDSLFKTEMAAGLGSEFSWNGYEHNALFLNRPGEGFLNAAFLLGVALEFDSRAAIAADLDIDGRPDLLVVEYRTAEMRQRLRLYRNRAATPGNWIGVTLDLAPGSSPIGAVVTAQANDRRWVKSITTGDGFTSQNPASAHFGLGQLQTVDKLEVRWPSGMVSALDNPAVGQYHRIPAGSP